MPPGPFWQKKQIKIVILGPGAHGGPHGPLLGPRCCESVRIAFYICRGFGLVKQRTSMFLPRRGIAISNLAHVSLAQGGPGPQNDDFYLFFGRFWLGGQVQGPGGTTGPQGINMAASC